MNRTRVLVAGASGLAGSALMRRLASTSDDDVTGISSKDLDLRDRAAVFAWMETHRPELIYLCAAKVGGILNNARHPHDFISDNLLIQSNVLDAALHIRTDRVVFVASSCAYPKFAPVPIREESLLTGELEPTNAPFAVAKIAGIHHVQAVRTQYGLQWISLMPTNLYGPNDNFDEFSSHVIPGLIGRFDRAVLGGEQKVTNWGTGQARREFLHSDDFADAAIFAAMHYTGDSIVNVGVGEDVSIREVSQIVAEATGFTGETLWDESQPDGTPRRWLDVTRMSELGWRSRIDLAEGIDQTVRWYRDNRR